MELNNDWYLKRTKLVLQIQAYSKLLLAHDEIQPQIELGNLIMAASLQIIKLNKEAEELLVNYKLAE